jgi:ABC-type uncharacterized transport system involved in gliding motility auxiliary subunit
MKTDIRRFAPAAYITAVVALLGAGGWFIVNRAFDTPTRILLGVAVIGIAAGILLDPERVRAALTGRQARYGSNAVLVTLALVGILGVGDYLAFTNPSQVDLTEDKQYSLTPETLLTLSQLKQPVEIKGFYTPDSSSSRDSLRPLLEQYRLHGNGKVTFDFVDPRSNPVAADTYGVKRDATLVVIMGGASQVTSDSTEQEITSAIVRLANPDQRKVYFLTGHGERDAQGTDDASYGQLKTALEAKNYKTANLNLLTDPTVPKDALAVIVAGPTVPLKGGEVQALGAYVDSGGSLVALLEPTAVTKIDNASDPLVAYLEQSWGVRLNDDLVVDLVSSMPEVGLATSYGTHAITAKMNNMGSYFPSARSLTLLPDKVQGVTTTGLVFTGTRSWGETDKASIASGQIAFDATNDNPGPLTLAAVAEKTGKNSRVVVFGDSDFATNAAFFGLGNGDLLVNSIDWAAHQDQLISLTPKQSTPRFVTPPSVQAVGLIFLITILLIPGAVIVLGVSIWLRRRRQA